MPKQINLPLRIVNREKFVTETELKLGLIQHFDILDADDFKLLSECLSKKADSKNISEQLLSVEGKVELNEFDKAELFLCFLGSRDDLNDKLVEKIDPAIGYNKSLFGDDYKSLSRTALKASARNIGSLALPRNRAKLAVTELVAYLTRDSALICKLIHISPAYLKCELVNSHILNLRGKTMIGCKDSSIKLSAIQKAISGEPIPRSKEYSYWYLDYYFNEVKECIKTSKSIQRVEDRNSYLKNVAAIWGIPEEFQNLLFSGRNNPSQTTLDIMTQKKMIEAPSTYRNVIAPRIKKIKSEYPYFRACDPAVEQIIDLPSKHPEIFIQNSKIWLQLEQFSFYPIDKSKNYATHHVSHPSTTIKV